MGRLGRPCQGLVYIVALALVVGLGALKFHFPLAGDQSLFLLGGKLIAQGKTLYLDFWDIKQPGIFYLYALAGRLFGFTQHGVRAFDLLWMVAFSLLLFVSLRTYFTHKWLSALPAVGALASYYAFSWNWQLSQLEAFIGLPIFLSLWLLSLARTVRARNAALFASGFVAGLVVAFKLALAPIFVVAFALYLFESAPSLRIDRFIGHCVMALLPYAAGVFSLLGLVALYFYLNGALELMLWTSFVFPFEVIGGGDAKPLSRLIRGLLWYSTAMLPWILLSLFAIGRLFRKDEPILSRMMVVWLVVSLISISIQAFSWYDYHFLLLFVPTAVLGARGADLVLQRLAGASAAATAAPAHLRLTGALVVLLSITAIFPAGAATAFELIRAFKQDHLGVEGFRATQGRAYQEASAAAAAIRAAPDPGTIYVFGNPIIYLLADRAPAIPVSGWTWEYHVESQWAALEKDLSEAAPTFVYVEKYYEPLLAKRAEGVVAMLARDFSVVYRDEVGALYRRAQPADPADGSKTSETGRLSLLSH